jgi:hypothetical protein
VGVREASHGLIRSAGWSTRVVVLTLVGAVALVSAGQSLGAVTPHLEVAARQPGPTQTLSVSVSRQKTDDPIGRIELVVPTGFTLSTVVVGKQVGTATARVVMSDVSASAEQTWSGSVVAASLTDPAIAYENASCDPGQHLSTWMVTLRGSGRTLSFPIFVDATTDANAGFGSSALVTCFRPADVPATAPNRAPNGAVIDSFALVLTSFSAPTTSGGYLWRSFWTPFTAGTGDLNASATVEAQSSVEIPAGQIDIFGTKSTIKVRGAHVVLLTVSGQMVADGQPQSSILVRIRHGGNVAKLVALGRVRTGGDGRYITVVALERKQYFQASADVPARDLGASGCQASVATVPCLDATIGAGHVASSAVMFSPK